MIIQSKRIGNLIREYRENKGFAQNKLADLLGCSPQFLGRIEKEEVPIPENTLVKAITVLKLPNYKLREAFLKNAEDNAKALFKVSKRNT